MVFMRQYKRYICSAALDAGFTRVRILSPFNPDVFIRQTEMPRHKTDAGSLLVCALPYGNQHDTVIPPADSAASAGVCAGIIAPFARFNYYREAVKRMKRLAFNLRMRYGGVKGDYRIFCNSPIPEKLIAVKSGLGAAGRNSLIINMESGSMFIIAAMTLPVVLKTDLPIKQSGFRASGMAMADTGLQGFPLCADCGENPPCAAACPTGAALGNGHIDRAKCIQWYASGHGASNFDADEIPSAVRAVWGNRLYGCVSCLDACIHNKRPINGVLTDEGPLPAFIDARKLLRLSDCEIKTLFKGTAMGLSWLGAKAIRRNAEMVLAVQSCSARA
jgi:epoxyqueuosine reductase